MQARVSTFSGNCGEGDSNPSLMFSQPTPHPIASGIFLADAHIQLGHPRNTQVALGLGGFQIRSQPALLAQGLNVRQMIFRLAGAASIRHA